MIGYLEGEIKYAQKNKVLILTLGVGYNVHVPENHGLQIGTKTSLYVHTHFTDNDLNLFGFLTPEDLQLFEILISVSGVGPKTAQNIFSHASSQNIIRAISESNLNFFTSISGVGKKTAQRLILDLKSKLSKGDINLSKLEGDSELVDSLISLGFQKSEISEILPKIDSSSDLQTQVKQSLKLLSK